MQFVLILFVYHHITINYFSELAALNERQKVDRRRVEDAMFQYAMLNISSWYTSILELSTLPMHAQATTTIFRSAAVYHGAFMKKYSGKLHEGAPLHVIADVLICKLSHADVCF